MTTTCKIVSSNSTFALIKVTMDDETEFSFTAEVSHIPDQVALDRLVAEKIVAREAKTTPTVPVVKEHLERGKEFIVEASVVEAVKAGIRIEKETKAAEVAAAAAAAAKAEAAAEAETVVEEK